MRVAGKAMVVRALQCAKACGMMVAREAGSVTSRSEVLCANATALMVLRVAGSVSFVSEVQHACEENDPSIWLASDRAQQQIWPRLAGAQSGAERGRHAFNMTACEGKVADCSEGGGETQFVQGGAALEG